MKYIVYCRKSSEEDSKQVQSLDTQQRILLEIATQHKLQVVDIVRESRSARRDQNRPLFSNVLSRIQQGEANALLVVHIDRLARNFIDGGYIIKMMELGVLNEVRTPYAIFDNVPSLMYMSLDFVQASNMPRDLSIKVLAGNKSKLLKGEYPGYAPLGYVNIQPGLGIEPDPLRASILMRAFELFAQGDHSVKSLSRVLWQEGLRSRLGKRISASSVHRILTNPDYYGVIHRGGKIYVGKHKPLITKHLFDQVQLVISGRSRPRKQKHTFTYRDFLLCEVCGCKMTAGITKGKYTYYRCTNGKRNCSQHTSYWSDAHVEKEFSKFFAHLTLDTERANASFELYKKSFIDEATQQNNAHTAILQQIANLERKLSRLEDMYLDEKINNDHFNERKTSIENELAQLQVLLKQQPSERHFPTLELVEEIKNQAIQLSEIFNGGDDQVKRDLLRSVLWNCDFVDGKITSTRLTKLWQPLESLNDSYDLEKWRRWGDSNPRDPCESLLSRQLP